MRSVLISRLGILAFLYLCVSIPLLGLPQIGSSSEAREAQVIDTILRDHEIILPLRNGLIPSKPPLFHWFGSGISLVLGSVSEFSTRLPSLLFSSLVLVLSGVIGDRIYQTIHRERPENSPGPVTFMILSLTYGFYKMATQAMVDMTFVFFTTISLYAVLSAICESFDEQRFAWGKWKTVFFLSCGVAALARGPLGIVLSGIVSFTMVMWIFGFKQAAQNFLKPQIEWLLTFAVPLIWYLPAFYKGGDAFVQRQILFENFNRFAGGEYINVQSWWFYIPSFLRGAFPWSIIFVVSFFYGLRSQVFNSFTSLSINRRARLILTPAIGFVSGVVLFSFSSGKRHSYLLPLFPLLAIYVAQCLNDSKLVKKTRPLNIATQIVIFILGLGGIITYCISSAMTVDNLLLQEAILWISAKQVFFVIYSMIVFSLALALKSVLKKQVQSHLTLLWFLSFALLVETFTIGESVKNRFKNFEPISREINEMVSQNQGIGVIKHERDEFFDPLLFYLRRRVVLIDRDQPDKACLPFLITRRSWMNQHIGEFRDNNMKIEELHFFNDLVDVAHNEKDREISLYSCKVVSSGDPRYV